MSKSTGREKEVARRQKLQEERAREATLTNTPTALPPYATLVLERSQWKLYEEPKSGKPYIVVKRPDGSEQTYSGKSAYTFKQLAGGLDLQTARREALTASKAQEAGKVVTHAMRDIDTPMAMDDPLRVFVLNPQSHQPVPLYSVFPSMVALMVVNCLDGRTTRLLDFASGETTFKKVVDTDGTVLVESEEGVLDLYWATTLPAKQRKLLQAFCDKAQEEFEGEG